MSDGFFVKNFQPVYERGLCIYFLPHRTTILPPVDELEDMLTKFEEFHVNFLRKYGRDV